MERLILLQFLEMGTSILGVLEPVASLVTQTPPASQQMKMVIPISLFLDVSQL